MGAKTLHYAWIYFSLSDDDPIQNVMPHGTYHVTGHFDESASGTSTYETLCGSSFTRTSDWAFFGLKFMKIGRELWRPMPCTTPETCRSATFRSSVPWIPTEVLKAKLEQDHPVLVPDTLGDPEPRVVIDDAMRGHYSVQWFGTSLTVDLTWDLEREVEPSAILELATEEWLPEWNEGEETTPIEITARLEGGRETEGKFRFILYKVTREPGYALNAGEKDDTSPDLVFEAGQPCFTEPVPTGTSEAWEIETTELVDETTVVVRARDYGAWAKLRCEVNVDGEWFDCRAEDGDDYITIPRDTDEDRIADSWEDQHGVRDQGEEDDEDATPEDQNSDADGISLYEEYRGFVDNDGEHQRLDPEKKELFVRDEDGWVAKASNFETGTGLTVIYIGEDGWTGPDDGYGTVDPQKRVVNFNTSGYGHVLDQHALHVTQDELLGNERFREEYREGRGHYPRPTLYGICAPINNPMQSPGTCAKTVLFFDSIEHGLRTAVAEVDMGRQTALQPEEIESLKQQVIGMLTVHEMGHGVGVRHHSPKTTDGNVHCYMRYLNLSPVVAGVQRFPSLFTRTADCWRSRADPTTESCWGQIQVSDQLP